MVCNSEKKGEKMKKWFIVSAMLVVTLLFTPGCSMLKDNWNGWERDTAGLEADIFMFSKLATRISLREANIHPGDTKIIEQYLVAIKGVLTSPGNPDFVGARVLVGMKLPKKYHIYGFTILDVFERYLRTANLNFPEDHKVMVSLISAGIEGALVSIHEFSM